MMDRRIARDVWPYEGRFHAHTLRMSRKNEFEVTMKKEVAGHLTLQLNVYIQTRSRQKSINKKSPTG